MSDKKDTREQAENPDFEVGDVLKITKGNWIAPDYNEWVVVFKDDSRLQLKLNDENGMDTFLGDNWKEKLSKCDYTVIEPADREQAVKSLLQLFVDKDMNVQGQVGLLAAEMLEAQGYEFDGEKLLKLEQEQAEPVIDFGEPQSADKQAVFTDWEFNGGKVVVNQQENRLQAIFNSDPDLDTKVELRTNGFSLSPQSGAWERQLTANAFRAADRTKCIQPITGETPSELQKKVREERSETLEQAVKGLEQEVETTLHFFIDEDMKNNGGVLSLSNGGLKCAYAEDRNNTAVYYSLYNKLF